MFTALKKLAKGGDERCPAPIPMSTSLQKKFSKGVHYNMKILIKGDRSVGKSCLLQRLQGGMFIEEYTPTDQIQVAPIHWAYKNTDHVVKVEVWEVVDKGRKKKKALLGLKLENQSTTEKDEDVETPILDATFLDVYKNASGVILMLDITKPWTFDYVVKELSTVPADIPVVVLGNHCDMQHHRQVHSHHIDQAIHQAKQQRSAPVRYAESSMRNGFGLRLLHKFLSVPFLRLQRTSLLEQLQRNQKDSEEIERDLDDFQNSEESHYNIFLDRLANKRRQNVVQPEPRPSGDHSPSIVLGGGKPIIPPGVNPLLAQSLNPTGVKVNKSVENPVVEQTKQTHYVSSELLKPKQQVSMDTTPTKPTQDSNSNQHTSAVVTASGELDEFYAGALDNSFLEDLTPPPNNQDVAHYESDSDDGNVANPMVMNEEDEVEIDYSLSGLLENRGIKLYTDSLAVQAPSIDRISDDFAGHFSLGEDTNMSTIASEDSLDIASYPMWAGDSSTRRSPEGGEDPDIANEPIQKKTDKKHKKKKSKDKEKGDFSSKSEKKDRKKKPKTSKNDTQQSHPQSDLLERSSTLDVDYDDYDSI